MRESKGIKICAMRILQAMTKEMRLLSVAHVFDDGRKMIG
jgi:hypothetical protein